MPIYEYACKACEKGFEIRQKIADAPLIDCPSCGAPELERLVSASSFALKGGGWYADGYGEQKKSKESSGTDAKDSTGKSEKKESSSANDSKPSSTDSKPSSTEAKKAS